MRRAFGVWAAAALLVMTALVPAAGAAAVSEAEPLSPPVLAGVACTSDSHCFAVGERYVGRHSRAFIKQWTGTHWVSSPTPDLPHKFDVQLIGVSCLSPTSCFAVGTYGTDEWARTLVLRWDGAQWSIRNSPNPHGRGRALLAGVTCSTGAGCVAVGSYGTEQHSRTLVERWNGIRWSIMRSPNPRGGHFALLNGVSCPAPTKCVAVGSYGTGARARTLVERWNGTKWWIERSPNPRGRHFSELAGVACPVVDSCIAVGDVDFGRTLIQRWDGTAWRIARSPTLPGDNYLVGLFSVACPSATDCVAVGLALDSLFGDPNASNQALIERWNGATWSTVPNPKLPLPALLGVACVSATSCYAVGSDFDRGPIQEHWNGVSWSLQT